MPSVVLLWQGAVTTQSYSIPSILSCSLCATSKQLEIESANHVICHPVPDVDCFPVWVIPQVKHAVLHLKLVWKHQLVSLAVAGSKVNPPKEPSWPYITTRHPSHPSKNNKSQTCCSSQPLHSSIICHFTARIARTNHLQASYQHYPTLWPFRTSTTSS